MIVGGGLPLVRQEREDALQRDKDAVDKVNDRWKEEQTRATQAKEEEVMGTLREAENAR